MTHQRVVKISCLLLYLPLLTILLCTAPVPLKADGGEIIKEIEVEGLTRISETEFSGLIAINTGDVLDRKALAIGIRRAFRKKVFQDIKAVSEGVEGGIKLRFIVKEIPIIRKVNIEGNDAVSIRVIRKALPFRSGEHFRSDLSDNARETIKKLYKGRGYADAQIIIHDTKIKDTSLVDLTVEIKEGQPLKIASIHVPSALRKYLKIKEGDVFHDKSIQESMTKITDHYKKQNYVNPRIGPYVFSSGVLDIPVKPGKKYNVYFKGNSAISDKTLKKELPFHDNKDLSDDSIEEAIQRIKRLYESRGYRNVHVGAGAEWEGDRVSISFLIVEGEKVILRTLSFNGVRISTDTLRNLIPLKEKKPYDENMLEKSGENIVGFYNALGYLKAEIVDIHKEFKNEGRDIDLAITVREGPQTKIREILIVGNRAMKSSRIKNNLKIRVGGPYNVIDISDSRFRILSLYAQRGYLDAHVEAESVIDGDSAFLTLKITENRQSLIGKIIIRGNIKTKDKVIWREFTLQEGDVYDQAEVQNIKQRLYKLGLFNEVSVENIDSDKVIEGKRVRDVLLTVKEGNAGSIEMGLGYGDYEKLRGSFDITYRNLGGYNRQIGFRTELSAVEKRYILNFSEPWFVNKPDLPLNLFVMKEETRSVSPDTRDVLYKIDRFSLLADVGKKLSDHWRINLNYEYSYVDTKDVDPGVILSREDTGTVGIGSISPSVFFDNRDDPFNPTSGSLYGLVMKFASAAFLSEVEFIKGTFQSAWFFKLRRRVVLAISLKGGASHNFDEEEELPLVERFFLGGRTTVRGYENDTLGPKGEKDTPTGGNFFALTNTELRFDIGKGFGIVTFIDSGNVWQTEDDIDGDFKSTVGLGLRYNTPVGPVRIDYGHKLDREPDESAGEVHFSFGHAF